MLNEFRVQTITWDKANSKIYEIIKASEGDSNGRKLRVQILDNGKAINLSGTSLSLAWKSTTNKGLDNFELVDANKGLFEIFYTTEMLSTSGKITASLVLIDSVGRLESDPFSISISRSIVDDDSVQSDNSFTALTEALVRVTDLEGNYAPRLNEVTAQLAHKLTKGEVSVSDIDKNKGKFDQTYMSDELLQQMTGSTPVNAVPAKDSVTNDKLAKNSVSSYTADFIKKSNNIINLKNLLRFHTLHYQTGAEQENQHNHLTDFIRVKPNTMYVTSAITRVGLYNETFEFISTTTSSSFETDKDTIYARFAISLTNLDTAQANEGSELLPYDVVDEKIDDSLIPSIDSNNQSFIEPSKNLFNKNRVIVGKMVDRDISGVGDIIDSTDQVAMIDLIEVQPNTDYSKSDGHGMRVAFFDSNMEFLKGAAYGGQVESFTTPQATKYMRISIMETAVDSFMLNIGNTVLPYSEHKHTITSTDEYPVKIDPSLIGNLVENGGSELNHYDEDYYVVDSGFNFEYTAPQMEDKSSGSQNPLGSVSVDDIYGLYDALMNEFPDYITKEFLGNESTGLPIYKYSFKPAQPAKEVGGSFSPSKMIKLLIFSGTHGVERLGVWTTYLTMREMCTNWESSEVLEALRWNVHFVVVPIVNPWGFANNERVNSNGVDINRNFPSEWEESDPSDRSYGGIEPLSELESQYVYQVMNENKDAIYAIDFHNSFGDAYHPKNFIWINIVQKFDATMGHHLISKVSRKWKKEIESFKNDGVDFYGYIVVKRIKGSVANEALNLGIGGSTFEIQNSYELEVNAKPFTALTNTLGIDAFVNWLAVVIRNRVPLKNRN